MLVGKKVGGVRVGAVHLFFSGDLIGTKSPRGVVKQPFVIGFCLAEKFPSLSEQLSFSRISSRSVGMKKCSGMLCLCGFQGDSAA
jgi:hypothetical protein